MFDFLTLFAGASSEAAEVASEVVSGAEGGGGGAMNWIQFAIIPVALVALYFIMIRPQQKRQKAERELRDNVQIGDTVVTIGGIVGIVTNVKEDNISIETGGGSRMVFKKFAIQTIETIHE